MMVFYLPLGRDREEAILSRLQSLLQRPEAQKVLFQQAGLSWEVPCPNLRILVSPPLLYS